MIHKIKIDPEYLALVKNGLKKAEFRFNDRNYKVGDLLQMQGYDRKSGEYIGGVAFGEITDITDVSRFIVQDGWVMISFKLKKIIPV